MISDRDSSSGLDPDRVKALIKTLTYADAHSLAGLGLLAQAADTGIAANNP